MEDMLAGTGMAAISKEGHFWPVRKGTEKSYTTDDKVQKLIIWEKVTKVESSRPEDYEEI